MPLSDRRPRQGLTRADLPAELTPDTLRHLGLRTLRELSRPGNGVLDAEEQRRFDAALAEVTGRTNTLLEESLRRAQGGGPGNLDPALRRSYERTRRRLAEQARWGRVSLPELDLGTAGTTNPTEETGTTGRTERPGSTSQGNAPGPTDEVSPTDDVSPTDELGPTDPAQPADPDETPPGPDVTPDSLEQQVEQTSDTLDMLEKIASLQQQQVEHQHSQLLSETRGFFFAFLVSVAVIIAGVAPLVEAEPGARVTIIVWTLVVTALAGIVYALVRSIQGRKKPGSDS